MSSKTFKLTAVAVVVMAATQANAALYRVVEITPTKNSAIEYADEEDLEYYGTAITPGTLAGTGVDTSCFGSTDCSDGSAYDLAGDTQNGTQGISLKKEVPFGVDNHFYYLNQDELEDYCDVYLKYSTCEAWAEERWLGTNGFGGLQREREAYYQNTYKTNLTAFDETNSTYSFTPDLSSAPASFTGKFQSGTSDQVVTSINSAGTVTGITSSGYYSPSGNYVLSYRQRGYFTSNGSSATVLEPVAESDTTIVNQMGRTMAYDSFAYGGTTYIVGSSAVAAFDEDDSDKDYDGRDVTGCKDQTDPALLARCQNYAFAMKAFVWSASAPTATRYTVDGWETSKTNYDEAASQASVRAAALGSSDTSYNGRPVLVGFNTDRDSNNMNMQAAVFRPVDNTASFAVDQNDAWDTTFISNATLEISSDYIYANSVATDVNQNLLVIGESKLRGDKPENGSAANKLFVANADPDTGSPTAAYLNDSGQSIFFSGAGGKANAVNNYNEIVGRIDAETHREINGKFRRYRGFIYPYTFERGDDSARRAVFGNKAWWLDNLTNGGTYSSSNNAFRILDATDINDAGVISATALKCPGGYDNTSHFSYCGDGKTDEHIVAVKLVPISGADSSDIVERAVDSGTTVSRKGAGLGWLSLGLLALFGFRRRK